MYGVGPGRFPENDGGVIGPREEAGESDPRDSAGVSGVGGEWTVVVREKRTCFPGIVMRGILMRAGFLQACHRLERVYIL